MVELIYSNRMYITGDMQTVQKRLSEYARHYNTVKELLAAKAPAPERP